ncbi:alpha/beta fold hydrolase [Methyloceanibacter caenitepidi]|uniref:Possible epoxide hydrolase-related protein n=1 Tax=Methyloceanibacter caenitepidi TaxID=1384459 RepID=A0A0A8K743_9HYPH|nr:alpha/beta hydrolase [Methyloceanibacter caenitepidi]BAQ18621.1 possible epoxide hydrolase-related protein [Methyloceanibacter caenitepidi]
MTYLKKVWLIAALVLLPFTAAYGIDRLVLAPSCPDCHAAMTEALPLFDGSEDGLVRIRANNMTFRARVAGSGNRDDEGVILLHGFPETSIMWEPLLAALRKAGYRAIAFDQRGYSPGARPRLENDYTKGKLANDVLAVADAAGFEKFHVIGHDFGGAIAWTLADRYPERVLSLTSLAMPHPMALSEALSNPSPQWPASSYVLFYRLPVVPELAMSFDQAALLTRWKWSRHPKDQVAEYRRVFGEPGAIHAALDWYRAFEFRSLDPAGKVRPPTLFLWGEEDGAFSRASAVATANYMDGPYRLRTLNAGHNLMLDAPSIVIPEVLEHLASAAKAREQWTAALASSSEEMDGTEASCDQVPPHCLRIQLSPEGKTFRIRNQCNDTYKGVVRVTCSAWAPDTGIEYRFNLGAKSELAQEGVGARTGQSNGTCYFRPRLCAKVTAPVKPKAASFWPLPIGHW